MRKKTKKIFFYSLLTFLILVFGVLALFFAWFFPRKNSPFYPAQKEPAIKVYFLKEDKIFAVKRPLKGKEQPFKKAFEELLAGPTQAETQQGITSYLPLGLKLLGFWREGPVVILNFNRELENYGGGTSRLQGMIAQIVYTATEIPGIEKVWIWMEGEKELILGGEGLVLDHPLSRREIAY